MSMFHLQEHETQAVSSICSSFKKSLYNNYFLYENINSAWEQT